MSQSRPLVEVINADPTTFEGVDWLIEAATAYKRGDRQTAIAAALISLAHTAEEGQ
jgi:hypothetical protein